MKTNSYPFCVSYIRAIENRLLNQSDIENLIMCSTVDETYKYLSDKGFECDGFSTGEYEKMLDNDRIKCWNEIKEIAPESADIDIMIFDNDFHNLKLIMKSFKINNDNYKKYLMFPYTVDPDYINECFKNGMIGNLPDMLREPAEEAYDSLNRTNDAQLCDIIIDRYAMDYKYLYAKERNNNFWESYVKLLNSLLNIKIAYRCSLMSKNIDFISKALSDYSFFDKGALIDSALSSVNDIVDVVEKNGMRNCAEALRKSPSDYEVEADNTILEFMESAKYISFGVEPIAAYIYAKQTELMEVRIILSAKYNGLDEQIIRKRLRKLYV